MRAELSNGSSPFISHPFFPPQQPKRQVTCMMLSVRSSEWRQASAYGQSRELVIPWLERCKVGPWSSECKWVHCAKSPCSYPKFLKAGSYLQKAWFPTLTLLQNPIAFSRPPHLPGIHSIPWDSHCTLSTAQSAPPWEDTPHHWNAFNSS